MAEGQIADRVLAHLRASGPAKARAIAATLGADRTTVNQALRGPLRGKVKQAKDFSWSIAGEGTATAGSKQKPEVRNNEYANLFDYYLDCLSQDDSGGIATFADSKYDLDYVELDFWPPEEGEAPPPSEQLRRLFGKQRRDSRSKTLWLGYPVYLRRARGRGGWEGSFV